VEAWTRRRGNLSERAAARRLRFGLLALAVALAAAVALAKTHFDPTWRLSLFVPFFFAAGGFYQGLYRT